MKRYACLKRFQKKRQPQNMSCPDLATSCIRKPISPKRAKCWAMIRKLVLKKACAARGSGTQRPEPNNAFVASRTPACYPRASLTINIPSEDDRAQNHIFSAVFVRVRRGGCGTIPFAMHASYSFID